MKGLKVKKEVAEQIKGMLKEPENSIFDMDFAEKLQNKAEKAPKTDIFSKLGANKDIFARGDFDEYKISDEELKAHEIEKGFNPDTPYTYELIEFENDKGTHIERLQKVAIKDIENAVFKGKIKNYWKTRKERQVLNDFYKTEFNKYFEVDYKDAQRKTVEELRKYVIDNSTNSNGNFYRNVEKYSYMSKEKNINTFCDKYVKDLGKKAAEFEANKKVLYEKIPGISDSEKKEIIDVLQDNCEKFPFVKFTLANYKKLFNNPIPTPLGKVKLGVHQSVKFKIYEREYLLKAVDVTLRNPSIIVKTREDNYLFVKQFKDNNGDRFVSSVVIDKGELIDVSNHEKKLNEILNLICEGGIKFKKNARVEKSYLNRTGNISIPQQNILSSKNIQKSLTYSGHKFLAKKEGKTMEPLDIEITDITEGNKQRKFEQFSKALNAMADNRPFVIKHIPADGSTKYNNLVVRIRDFDRSKIEKAVHKVALSLDSNVKASSKGESFVYKTQEEITENFYSLMTEKAKAIYDFVIGYFDLPDIRIVSKAGELKYKGKVLYNPETGMPIKDSEWKKFVAELEKLLNRNYDGVGDKIVLSAESLGMILERLSKTNSFEAIKKMSLSDLKAKRYDVDWISESIKNMKDKFGDAVSRERQARIQIAMNSAAQRVTRVKDDMRNNIQQIVIDGMRDKQSKSVVAQNLFDKCASLNRDMQRIADSEIQMATNSAYCNEEVYNSKPGEKVYFKRFEIIDDNTCKQCKKLNGTVVLWSDVPLPDEHIKDPYAKYAIWDGKNEGSCPLGIVHPFCRGGWVRFYPDVKMN